MVVECQQLEQSGVTPIYDLASGEQLTTLRAIKDNDGYYFNSNYNMNYRYDDKTELPGMLMWTSVSSRSQMIRISRTTT